MLRNCGDDSRLTIYVLCSRLSISDKDNVRKLLEMENYGGESIFINYDAGEVFKSLRGFNGDYTTYGKLLISRLVKEEEEVLYLDSDLIINLDVLELDCFDFQGKAIAAVFGSQVKNVLDRSFLIENQQWHEDTAYFNAGVILFNLSNWRQENMDERWELMARDYPKDFISHDQTIFNALSKGSFVRLPANFNVPWKPGKTLTATDETIIHFVGSPKPWDIFGNFIHPGYSLWRSYSTKYWDKRYYRTSTERTKRAWHIRWSIARHLVYARFESGYNSLKTSLSGHT